MALWIRGIRDLVLMWKWAQKEAWPVVLRRDPCVYCGLLAHEVPGGTGRKWVAGGATKMTVEHVVPRGIGLVRPPGWENQVAACWNCNNSRGNAPLLQFMLMRSENERRFQPGPNNARNRARKQYHRDRIETRRRRLEADTRLMFQLRDIFPRQPTAEQER